MGTSSSYGGSNSQAWRDVRELWGDFEPTDPPPDGDPLPQNTRPADPPPGNTNTPAAPEPGLDSLGAALANALLGAQRLNAPAARIPLNSVLPRRSSGGAGSGAGSGGGGGASRGAGGTGARRDFLRQAARGGAAIGAATAYRDRDQAALDQFGISLEALDAMTARQRCAAILDLVLGEAAHPDEQAIRTAAIEQVKKITADSALQQSALQSLRDFIGTLAVQIGLVELGKQIRAGTTSKSAAAAKERDLKHWVTAKIRALNLAEFGTVRSVDCHQAAYDLARRALRLMAAR